MKFNSAIAAAILAFGVYADDASKVDSTESSSSVAAELPTFTVSASAMSFYYRREKRKEENPPENPHYIPTLTYTHLFN